ncbi:MAG: peptidylprolyl isomerase [Planctomycetota bacterium]
MRIASRLPSVIASSLFVCGGLAAGPVGCGVGDDRYDVRSPRITAAEPDERNDPASVGPASAAEAGTPVEAMVGQIAGRPIYAHHVLDGMEQQLATLGRRLPARAFREQATALVFEQVRGLVRDALIRDEADRALTPQQRFQLDFFVNYQREELLRRYGRGSRALAERAILEETGLTFAQNLRDLRTQAVISTYLDQNLRPLIDVNRRDIERYYRDNFETFNPPTKRAVRFIYAADDEDAAWFLERLDAGEPFVSLMLDDRNLNANRSAALEVEGDGTMFGPAIDPAVMDLEEGGWAGPMPNRGQRWFVFVEEMDQPAGRTLFEAQVEIERALRLRRERELQIELGERLRGNASFTDEMRMTEAVVEIAAARYAGG